MGNLNIFLKGRISKKGYLTGGAGQGGGQSNPNNKMSQVHPAPRSGKGDKLKL